MYFFSKLNLLAVSETTEFCMKAVFYQDPNYAALQGSVFPTKMASG